MAAGDPKILTFFRLFLKLEGIMQQKWNWYEKPNNVYVYVCVYSVISLHGAVFC